MSSKPIKRKQEEKTPKKITKKWIPYHNDSHFVLHWKNESNRRSYKNYDIITRSYTLLKNQRLTEYQGSNLTVKHIKCEVFFSMSTGFTTYDVMNFIFNTSVNQKVKGFAFDEQKYKVQDLLCDHMVQAKAYLMFNPDSNYDYVSNNVYYDNVSNIPAESYDNNIFRQHPEWILDSKVFPFLNQQNQTFTLESSLARNLRPGETISIVLVFKLKSLSWKLWYPKTNITTHTTCSIGY